MSARRYRIPQRRVQQPSLEQLVREALRGEGIPLRQLPRTLLAGVFQNRYPDQREMAAMYHQSIYNPPPSSPTATTPLSLSDGFVHMYLRQDLRNVFMRNRAVIKDVNGDALTYEQFNQLLVNRVFKNYVNIYAHSPHIVVEQGSATQSSIRGVDIATKHNAGSAMTFFSRDGSFEQAYELFQQRITNLAKCQDKGSYFQREYDRESRIIIGDETRSAKERVLAACKEIEYEDTNKIVVQTATPCQMNSAQIDFANVFRVDKRQEDEEKTPKQYVFGFTEQLEPYHKCKRYFRTLQSYPSFEEDPCARLAQWTLTLNKLFTYCSQYGLLDLPIRFLIPNGMTHVPKYGTGVPVNDIFNNHIFVGTLVIDVYDDRQYARPGTRKRKWVYFLFYTTGTPLFSDREFFHGEKEKIRMFDIYGYNYWLGLLMKMKNITYDEFSILARYLRLNLYYSLQNKRIMYMSHKELEDQYLTSIGLGRSEIRFNPARHYNRAFLKQFHREDGMTLSQYNQLSTQVPWDVIPVDEYLRKHRGVKVKQVTQVTTGGAPSIDQDKIHNDGREDDENEMDDVTSHPWFMFDEIVASSLYEPFVKIYIRYHSLFIENNVNKGYLDASIFTLAVYPYEFIAPQHFSAISWRQGKFKLEKVKNQGQTRILKMSEYLDPDRPTQSIIKYKPFDPAFFEAWEILQTYQLLKNDQKVLELTIFPVFLEACNYRSKKNNIKNVSYDLVGFPAYSKSEKSPTLVYEEYVQYLTQYIDVNWRIDKGFLTEEKIFDQKRKYNLIFLNLFHSISLQYFLYEEYLNIRTLFYQILYGINHLEKNGSMVILTSAITKKFHADVIFVGKHFFKKVDLYFPEVRNLHKQSKINIVFRDFKGLSEEKKSFLRKVFKKLYEDDPTGREFDPQNPMEYAEEFTKLFDINEPANRSFYDFVREFNFNLYSKRISFYNKLINLKELDKKEQEEEEKEIRREQYINSVIWARKYDLEYYERDPETFQNEFERLILQDMYSLHNEISFRFTQASNNNTERTTISDAFQKLANRIWLKSHLIDTRDFRYWSTIRRKIAFYRPMFKEIDLVKRVQRITGIQTLSQAWLKLFEILVKYPLLPKRGDVVKSFHMCEAPGNFISATEYYVKERTEIKNLDWKAQSLHPSQTDLIALKDHYGFIKKYPNRWLFGPDKTGDITDLKNLEYYGTQMKGCKLVTSDCGVAEELKDYEEIATKVAFCQIVGVLNGLDEGANMVLKVFQKDKVGFHVPALFSAFYQAYRSFDKFYVHKSSLNRQSPEFYIVGIGYKPIDKGTVREMMDSIPKFDKSKDFFETYPTSFMFQMEKAMTELAENFVFEIERIIFYFDNYDELGVTNQNQIKKYIDKKNDDWLEKVGLI
jgi:23S rRNA U2552 (ribose-2'-O)-methylase RlmE/FtsJ